ncbi:MAG: PHP domain-containing protein [Candidatus Omnitrophota bacterium]
MQKKADLHVHTNLSDSTFTPEEVVRYATKIGLAAIAICDHDVVDGIDPAVEEAKKHGIEVIPGVELSAEYRNRELHILGYFIDHRNKGFRKKLQKTCRARIGRIHKMLAMLKKKGIDLAPEDVFSIGGEGSVGRLHLAVAMFKKGLVGSVPEAFKKYIGDGGPCYVSNFNFTPERAIYEIVKAGGVPVLAHPYIAKLDKAIPHFVKHGLMGLEVYHPEHSPSTVKHYEDMARQQGLLITGGSDCHGQGKSRILMGTVSVPYEIVDRLKAAARAE